MFVHGAMCMAYSGNCTISNYTQARDSNRGGCVHSCRFPYSIWENSQQRQAGERPALENVNFMSSRDLRGMEHLPRFIDAQISSLKIEGRMKSNLYVASTVSNYAKALQACSSEAPTRHDPLATLLRPQKNTPPAPPAAVETFWTSFLRSRFSALPSIPFLPSFSSHPFLPSVLLWLCSGRL